MTGYTPDPNAHIAGSGDTDLGPDIGSSGFSDEEIADLDQVLTASNVALDAVDTATLTAVDAKKIFLTTMQTISSAFKLANNIFSIYGVSFQLPSPTDYIEGLKSTEQPEP